MDTVIQKKKGIKKKHIPFIAGGVVVLGVVLWLILGDHSSKMNVNAQRVTISDVVFGDFNDYVRVNGQVQPISVVQISAVEGGIVEEKPIEEGSMVRKGDVIARLVDSRLSLSILDTETRIAEQENNLRNTQVTMEQQRLSLRQDRLQAETDMARKKRRYEQYKRLYEEKLCSREEALTAEEDYRLSVGNLALITDRQKQDSIYRSTQIENMEESLKNMRLNLAMAHKRIDDLNIKAPVDGQLGLLEVEIGQSVGSGARIGQVNVLSDYKVEAFIDEHYIDRVKPGLSATFERQDRNFGLALRRVFPEVRSKQFRTEFVFTGERPDNIRAGQTYYINLELGEPAERVMIPRGAFYQTTGGKWIFVVSPDGSRAVRRQISIGRQNPNYYEVTGGLEPGEKVVISGYDAYGDAEQLIFK